MNTAKMTITIDQQIKCLAKEVKRRKKVFPALIEKAAIKWSEPDDWRITKGVEHHYCYGCSDV